jgi:hypothetical protein
MDCKAPILETDSEVSKLLAAYSKAILNSGS